MKDKPNEWVSISDLMSGVMAVVMLLLVMSVLQKTWSDIKHKQEMEQGINAQRARVGEMLGSIKTMLDGTANEGLVALDVNSQKITLRDGVFNRGSACIASQASQALATIETQVVRFLTEFRSGQVYIEGYTDNLPVTRPVTNFESFCTVYDDNFTLSAARAREARKFIVGDLAQAFARRVIVAGYGDSQPIPGVAPEDARQRRIEVRFVLPEK
ncbi:OmpA/MotB family protein [Yersinia enterocolitica]|uniref:OmpA-like domain-containing protein n=1 Tax=Klebsiella michiganensis TaxID=1134687 RepID=A0ABR5GES9_9ENTR|nr:MULTISPECIES: OmpA family protein [Enterobacterales]AUW13387.1 flagellar motor protein MotB [Klebsiella oxytoca]EKN3528013.1 OmpA family protein [Yersinia enterocolitica]EKN6347646.1 flagellar motor protein MotB [Yersinia enterocolitica]ELI8317234.1 OmpA family protein [Yersinia enterocolitica]ELI8321295.1 OmpA family protein [Yersinia enterocolitica]